MRQGLAVLVLVVQPDLPDHPQNPWPASPRSAPTSDTSPKTYVAPARLAHRQIAAESRSLVTNPTWWDGGAWSEPQWITTGCGVTSEGR